MNLPSYNIVDPMEAVVAFRKGRTIEDCYIVEAIYKAYTEHHKISNYGVFDCLCMYATIWNAGRMQGIREERQKKKTSKSSTVQS